MSPQQLADVWSWWHKEISPWLSIILGAEAKQFAARSNFDQWLYVEYRLDHHHHYRTHEAPPPLERWAEGILHLAQWKHIDGFCVGIWRKQIWRMTVSEPAHVLVHAHKHTPQRMRCLYTVPSWQGPNGDLLVFRNRKLERVRHIVVISEEHNEFFQTGQQKPVPDRHANDTHCPRGQFARIHYAFSGYGHLRPCSLSCALVSCRGDKKIFQEISWLLAFPLHE